ncbi:hypothetical protein B1810_16060 [Panacagrimonas perspica]|nr:hypothetical protein B1810_16060 [Panacagrimonas perspica]
MRARADVGGGLIGPPAEAIGAVAAPELFFARNFGRFGSTAGISEGAPAARARSAIGSLIASDLFDALVAGRGVPEIVTP